MHEDLGHSREQRMLAEICRRYFWHSQTEDVKSVVATLALGLRPRLKGCKVVGQEERSMGVKAKAL